MVLGRFPRLRPSVVNSESLAQEKALVFMNDVCPQKISRGFPIRAILLPRVTGLPDTRLRKATPAAALKALAPTTIFHLQGASREAFQKMSLLARRVPSYVLELGTGLPQIPAAILELLRKGAP